MDPQDHTRGTAPRPVPRPAGRAAQKAATRQAIADAVLDLLEERGFGNFTAEDAATAAGVSRRTFFNHFSSVEEACFSYTKDLTDVLHGRMEPYMAEGHSYLEAYLLGCQGLHTEPAFRAVARGAMAWERMRITGPAPRYAQLTWVRAVSTIHDMLNSVQYPDQGPLEDADDALLEEQKVFLASAILAAWGTAYFRWGASETSNDSPESLLELERQLRLSTQLLVRGNVWPRLQREALE